MNGKLADFIWLTVIWACWALPCQATVVNGTFDTDLTGWTLSGDVEAVPGAASLGDEGASHSLLYQGIALNLLDLGAYTIDFDFMDLLSSELPIDPFAFPDAFFASLYFTDDIATFDLAGSFDDVQSLLDLDAGGPFNVAGTIDASPLGGDWLHFHLTFNNAYAYAVPVFELFDLNALPGDSEVLIDNVAITERAVIPEPATLLLVTLGLGAGVLRRRRAWRG